MISSSTGIGLKIKERNAKQNIHVIFNDVSLERVNSTGTKFLGVISHENRLKIWHGKITLMQYLRLFQRKYAC